jgi:carbon monoxide dehydrogenase subunit G
MATLRSDARIARPADEVWKVVSDVGGIGKWFPGIESAELTPTGRTISIAGGITLNEDVVTNDHALRRFQYKILPGGPVPVEFHLGTVDVLEDGAGSRVIYGTDIAPDSLAAILGPSIEAAVAGLKDHVEKGG